MTAGLSAAENQVKKSTEAMAAKFASIGKTMTIVGGAVTAAFGIIIKKTMEAGDQFDKMALRTGESVENLSSLAYACDITGTSIEGLELGIKFLTKGMQDASKGTGLAKEAFEELGISITDTEGNLRPTVDILKEAATKIAAIENPAKQAALAMELFGARSGTQLIPLLKEGGAGIEELMNKAKELGITMSTEAASAAAEFKDRLTDLKGSIAGAGRDIAMILIPPLTKLAEKAVEIIKKIREWADAHKPLVEWIVKIGATLGVLAVIGGPILLAVSAFLKMKLGILAVITALKLLDAKMISTSTITTGTLVPSIAQIGAKYSWLGAPAVGPIAIVGIAVAGLYAAWKTNLFGMRDITIEAFNSIKGNFARLTEYLGGGGGGAGAFATNIDNLADSMDDLGEEAKDAIEEIDKAIKEINDRLYELTHTTMENAIRKLDEQKQAYIDLGVAIGIVDEWHKEEIKKLNDLTKEYDTFLDAMKTVEDRLYELSHTEEEVAAKNLLAKKEQLEESVKAAGLSAEKEKAELTKIREWYDKEIALIISKLEEQQKAEIETAEKTEESANKQREAIRGIKEEYSGLITKIEDVGKAAEAAAKAAEKAAKKAELEVFLAGVPTIAETGYVPSYIPSLQTGGIVPKTGLYMLHKNEEVRQPNQNSYDYSTKTFSPNVYLTVSGSGNAQNIAYEVKKVLDESIRQFRRSGFELVPGRG